MTVHDEALAVRIRNALAIDKRIAGLPIDVRVSNGDVYVKGKVDALEQADVIQFIISGIAGVHHVDVSELEPEEGGR